MSDMPKKLKEDPKSCRMCDSAWAVSGEKYCKRCKKVVLSELKASGYLSDEKPPTMFSDQRGRNATSSNAIGGSSEFGSDGDDW